MQGSTRVLLACPTGYGPGGPMTALRTAGVSTCSTRRSRGCVIIITRTAHSNAIIVRNTGYNDNDRVVGHGERRARVRGARGLGSGKGGGGGEEERGVRHRVGAARGTMWRRRAVCPTLL
jgi:hypothetical protein